MATAIHPSTVVQLGTCSICTWRAGSCSIDQTSPHKCPSQPPPPELCHDGLFYRVYDSLSQSQYSPDDGFLCGEASPDQDLPERRYPRAAVKKHLDWYNRDPTPYISIFSSFKQALRECRLRSEKPDVYRKDLGWALPRGQVRVAVIAGLETLIKNDVYLTSLAHLRNAGVLTRDDGFAWQPEWLVLDQIPASCVVADGTAEEFMECCTQLGDDGDS
ncbi:hypothetical protein BJY01DRAFT_217898 [Aspergillus pseudoustus]|uniref:DUF7587 domain-containing protein n=1 Tax=Aspergillus pseudoustus TaxID=1810923 RepID=A0ABR4JM91_9EURO